MKQLFKPHMYKNILALLVLLLIVKFVWVMVSWLWLPSSGVEHVSQKGGKALYYRVKLTPNEVAAPTKEIKAPTEKTGSIDDIVLLAIYNATDNTVITVAHKSKTKILSRGEDINGFVLQGAGRDFATFTKSEKSYKVMLSKGKSTNQNNQHTSPIANRPSSKYQAQKVKGEIVDAGDHKIVDRALLNHYTSNMEDIYKNIGISDHKEGNSLKGFNITFVRKNSPFAKLGVKRGDIIKSINGQALNSYNTAFGIYKNMKNIDNVTLVIQRGKEEMELEYEIN